MVAVSTQVTWGPLKRTLLTWCAKYGLDLPTRSLLGYHVSTEHSSAMVYYRDAMAGPLRCLDVVLLAVRKKDFHPDKTRSGYLPGKRQLFIEPQPKTKAGPRDLECGQTTNG